MARIANRNAGAYIAARQRFEGHNFAGRMERGSGPTGRLEGDELARYRTVLRRAFDARQPLYVVYSYATPIAWIADGSTDWHVSNVTYSPTTSWHQGYVRAAIAPASAPAPRTAA